MIYLQKYIHTRINIIHLHIYRKSKYLLSLTKFQSYHGEIYFILATVNPLSFL